MARERAGWVAEGCPIHPAGGDPGGVFLVGGQEIAQGEHLVIQALQRRRPFQGDEDRVALELRAALHHVQDTGAGTTSAGLEILNDIIGDVSRADRLACLLDVVQELGRHGGAILNQFFGVLATDKGHRLGNDGSKPGNDVVDENGTCIWTHNVGFARVIEV